MKKLFTLLLSLATCIGTLFAESGTCGDNLTWDLTNGVLTISGTGDMTNWYTYVFVPWNSYREDITSVTIGNSVTSIGVNAFRGCSSLTSVTIGNSVTSIGVNAFFGCSSLTSVIWNAKNCQDFTSDNTPFYRSNYYDTRNQIISFVFGEEVEHIPAYLCAGMTNLTSIEIPNSVTSIEDKTFENCSGLTSVTIGNSVTSIGMYAFDGCSSLMSITIPNNVTSIADYAFAYCSSLTSITIPNSVTSIGKDAFAGCSSLTSVTIGNSVTSIGYSAFDGCSSLTTVIWNAKNCQDFTSDNTPFYRSNYYDTRNQIISFVFGEEVEHIPAYLCRGMTNLTSIEIPNSVTSIEDRTFSNCSGLTSVIIGNSVASIGYAAFEDCSGLTSVTIGNSVTHIEWCAFRGCSGLTSVTIPNSVTHIGEVAFKNCSSMTSVSIGNSVTYIGNGAFSDCTSLTSITIPNSVTSIVYNAFKGCSGLTSVTIGSSVTSIGEDAFDGCSSLTSVIWNAKNCQDFTYDNRPFYDPRNQIISFVFGEEVEYIPAYLCAEMTNLTSIEIPNSVTSIGQDAFYGCSGLTSVTIGLGVQEVGFDAFRHCDNLAAVHISDLAAWCAILFPSLYLNYANPLQWAQHLYLNNIEITDLVIPYNVTSIGKTAFLDCNALTSVTIPNSVTNIGAWAFYWCSNLTSIDIGSGVTSIGYEAFAYCSKVKRIICRAKTPPIADPQAFTEVDKNIPLYVPASSIDLYKAAEGWKDFYNILGLDPITVRLQASSATAWSDVKLFYFGDGIEAPEWPGVTVNKDADGWYSYTFDTSTQSVNIIWTDGNNQTVDIENVTTSTCYRLNSTSGNKIDVTVIDCAIPEIHYYTVTFKDWNGTILKTEHVGKGYSATAPANPTRSGYMFTGWDRDFTNIQSDLIVTAQYVQNANGAGITVRLDPQSCTNWETVYLWAWTSEGNWFATWPGTVVDKDTDGWYAYTFAENIDNVNILWSDGTNQTVDITNVSESTCYALNSTTGTTITVTVVDCPTVTNPDSVLYPDSVSYVRIELIGEETTKTKSRAFKLSGSKDNFSQDVTGSAYYSIKSNEIVTYNGFTGYKFNDSEQHIGLTFPKGKLQTGDVVNVYITKISGSVGDGYLHFFSDYGVTELVDVKENHGPGVYSFTLGDNASELEAIYLFRRQKGSTKDMNPYVAYMEIVRGIALPTQVVITIEPGSTFADIAWPQVTGAATYELVIQNQDGSIVCTLIFNAQGQLVSITFNTIKRNNAPQQTQTTGFSYTIDGLESNTTYNYTLAAKDERGNILYTQSGTFTTTASQGIDEIHSSSTSKKVIINGQLFIRRGNELFNAQGARVK